MGMWIKPNSLKRMTKGNAVCRCTWRNGPLSRSYSVLSHNTLGLTNHPPFHLTYVLSPSHHYIESLVSIYTSIHAINQSPIHFSNNSTAHVRHIQPIIIPYHPVHSEPAPIAARWLTVGVRRVGGVTHRDAGWYAVSVDGASKKNAIPRNHEQNLSSRELKNAWKGIGGISSILAAHTLRSVPNCDVKRSVTCHVLWNSPGSRNVGHEVPPSFKNTTLRFFGCLYPAP